MQGWKIIFLIVVIVLITACTTTPITCNKPYLKVGKECCLDTNDNSICDKDENAESGEILVPVVNNKEEAENVAKLFLVQWERKNYDQMYDLLAGSLTGLKSKEEFVWLMEHEEFNTLFNSLRYEGIVFEGDNTAFVQYTIGSTSLDVKAPSMELVRINSLWKVNALGDLFIHPCGDNMCSENEWYDDPYISHFVGNLNEGDCPLDCFSKEVILQMGTLEQVGFFGHNFAIKLVNLTYISNTNQLLAGVYVNGRVINIDRDFLEKIEDNIYLNLIYGDTGGGTARIALLNKDFNEIEEE